MTLRTIYKAEHQAWLAALARCYNTAEDSYPRYGGSGITVYERWHDHDGFFRFLDHIGPKPTPAHSLDRIDGSLDYQPGNVRWATREQQNRNRSSVVLPDNVLDEIARVAEETGIRASILQSRYRRKGVLDTSPVAVKCGEPTRRRRDRQTRVVALLEQGKTQREIADMLSITPQGVRLLVLKAQAEAWR